MPLLCRAARLHAPLVLQARALRRAHAPRPAPPRRPSGHHALPRPDVAHLRAALGPRTAPRASALPRCRARHGATRATRSGAVRCLCVTPRHRRWSGAPPAPSEPRSSDEAARLWCAAVEMCSFNEPVRSAVGYGRAAVKPPGIAAAAAFVRASSLVNRRFGLVLHSCNFAVTHCCMSPR